MAHLFNVGTPSPEIPLHEGTTLWKAGRRRPFAGTRIASSGSGWTALGSAARWEAWPRNRARRGVARAPRPDGCRVAAAAGDDHALDDRRGGAPGDRLRARADDRRREAPARRRASTGTAGTCRERQAQMHFQTLWPQRGRRLSAGAETRRRRPVGSGPAGRSRRASDGDRDLKLFDAIVASMNQTYTVDKRRIYVTGFSNGGVFSYLLWAERAKKIAAVGEVAGRLDPAETLTTPRALLAIAGRLGRRRSVRPPAADDPDGAPSGSSGGGERRDRSCREKPRWPGARAARSASRQGRGGPPASPTAAILFARSAQSR